MAARTISFAMLATTVLVAGCASTGTQVNEFQLTQFQKGVTTIFDVERQFGAPQNSTVASDGSRTIMYVYSHAQAKGASFIPIVGLFAGGATADTNIATFRFDSDGKLVNYSASSGTTDMRTGLVSGNQTK